MDPEFQLETISRCLPTGFRWGHRNIIKSRNASCKHIIEKKTENCAGRLPALVCRHGSSCHTHWQAREHVIGILQKSRMRVVR